MRLHLNVLNEGDGSIGERVLVLNIIKEANGRYSVLLSDEFKQATEEWIEKAINDYEAPSPL